MAERRTRGDGALFQRGRRGSDRTEWVARVEYRGRGGKRLRREFTGPTPDAAMGKRDEFNARRRDGFTLPKGREPSVSDWMLHWLHNVAKGKVAATTWDKSYRQKVTDLICPYFESVPLSQLSEEDVEAWHAELEATVSAYTGRPYSAQTIKHAHRIMSRALKIAVVRRKIGHNPCSNVSPPTVDEIELQPPAPDEVRRILARCESWPYGARWVVAMTTGLRQGEALALTWRDVRLAAPASVTVRMSVAWIGGQRTLKPPKSKASRRSVPLAAVTVAALRELQQAQPVADLAGTVFVDGRGRPVHPRADWQDWKDLLADLGLPDYRVHDLRHLYATMLLEAGVDRRVVQAMMGHSTVALMARYQHVREAMHAAVAAAVDGAVSS